LKEKFLKPSIKGEKVACLGVSEVGAGSDVASKLRAGRHRVDEQVFEAFMTCFHICS